MGTEPEGEAGQDPWADILALSEAEWKQWFKEHIAKVQGTTTPDWQLEIARSIWEGMMRDEDDVVVVMRLPPVY